MTYILIAINESGAIETVNVSGTFEDLDEAEFTAESLNAQNIVWTFEVAYVGHKNRIYNAITGEQYNW